MTRTMRLSSLLLTALLAGPAHADMRSVGQGADLSPADMAHIFAETCFADSPESVVRNAAAMGRVLSLEDAYTESDSPVDLTDLSETLRLTADGDRDEATCTMVIDAQAAGDGADLYDGIEAHLIEWLGDTPEADAVDGGLAWRWQDDRAAFALIFTEGEDAFTLALDIERRETDE